jgi:gas vesicle structural protein
VTTTTTVTRRQRGGYLERPTPSGLAEVVDLILDKGLVIDIYVRVALVGIEVLTIDARIVIASVDTYLRFAEAVNRLDLTENGPSGLPDLIGRMTEGGAKHKTRGALSGVRETAREVLGRDDSGGNGSDGHRERARRREYEEEDDE